MRRSYPALFLILLGAGLLIGLSSVPSWALLAHESDLHPASSVASLPGSRAGPGAVPILPAAETGQLRIIVGSRDASLVPNAGIRCNLTDWQATSLPGNTSFQVGAEETIGSYTAVFGLFENTRLSPRPFFSVFDATTDALVQLTYWNGFPVIAGGTYDFELVRIANTSWTLSVNGLVFGGNQSTGSFNFGVEAATLATGIGFSEVAFVQNVTPVPPSLRIPIAFAVLQNGSWQVPNGGYLFSAPAAPPPWGVEGRAQSSQLAPDELVTGTAVPLTANNTTLWNGGALPVDVSLAAQSPTVTGTTELVLEASVSTASAPSAPLPNVTLAFRDTLGSQFVPVPATTGANGSVEITMLAANVSRPSTDSILASVSLLGYTGSEGVSVVVTPPNQVLLSIRPTSVSLASAAQIPMTVTATFINGTPAVNVPLAIGITGPASIEPVAGLTGSGGILNLTLAVEGKPGQVVVTLTVSGGGEWGHLAAVLGNESTFNFLATYGIYIVVGVVAAIAGVVVWLGIRDVRRRSPMPPMGFAANQETPPTSATSTDETNRTPPEGGSP